ncbi:1-deoxy-D-xylulose-5-phosphate synthase [Cloacibacillus evryensis]|uniref:1-deoxy-D-xylulose-5-phosphate synthase n=1 Tax=Cloacibacillus evryensis TaxID=508460 RepID=UPI002671A64C|nr:1-deoxy-D-xylulose-5-phosphate synthase [Cloacibacillus evryensis]
MSLLESVGDFRGLYGLSEAELQKLCAELRKNIIDVTLENGGHLSSSLGTVELTVALLRVFNPDADKIIFDVGHQSYAYKLLTKRLDRFATLRRKGGLAGFPRMDESPYDFFTTGHSSTSISAAMGYAKARDLMGEGHEVVAVIGDGALLNGVSFEALNSLASIKSKVIIILNDNKMSINPRVGGMASHLAKLAVNPTYKKLKDYIKTQCTNMKNGENINSSLSKIKMKLKSLLLPTNVFEELNISYWGPFNGHNIAEMEEVFRLARHYDESLLIHVMTQKGKGCPQAEAFPSFFHGIGPKTKIDAATQAAAGTAASWSGEMARVLCDMAREDPRLAVCTAAMKDGTKLENFAKAHPQRFFDTGIAEEHMLIYAAGLAAAGMRPVVCIYSTFLQRAADQVMHDICLPKLPVLLGIDRAGLVGEDGETHHGILDVAWLRSIPEMTIAAPRDAADLEFFVREWKKLAIPMAVRYPRGKSAKSIPAAGAERVPAPWGKLEVISRGAEICLIGVGSTVELMMKSADEIEKMTGRRPTVADLRFIKPLDREGLDKLLTTHAVVVTAEENTLAGGVGEAISSYINEKRYGVKIASAGVPDHFISHAARAEQWEECGLSVENILRLCVSQ